MSKFNRLFSASLLGFATLSMNGCDAIYWNESTSLAKTQEITQVAPAKSELRVVTLKNPLTYSTDKTGHKFGIDHDLLESFADHYKLKLRFIPVNNEVELRQTLRDGKADVAAARLQPTGEDEAFLIGPAYEETYLSLFCTNNARVETITDLNNKNVSILSKDSNFELYQRLVRGAPEMKIQAVTAPTVQGLFRQMAAKELDCAIAENLEGEFYARYYASVNKVAPVTGSYAVNWLVRPELVDLNRLMQAWFQKASRNDEIMRVHDRYKLYLTELDQWDVIRFMKQSRDVLPDFVGEFRQAAREHHLPWQLIAAVSYQESQWDNEAVSYTGVRGLMQLTRDTADHLGVEDRTDPVQSIWGGAKYLRYLMNKTPRQLNFKDRLALTLAAYNIGFGHLKDAQRLAEMQGKNPYSWRHLRTVLPLLENSFYAGQLEYGPARGNETVAFVERVSGFYNLMVAIQP